MIAALDEYLAEALSCANTEEAIGQVEVIGLTKTADQLRQARARGQLISIRTRAGLARAKTEGRKGGRPPRLSPDDVAEIRHLWADGKGEGVTALARRFSVSRQTVYRALGIDAA